LKGDDDIDTDAYLCLLFAGVHR